MSITSAAVGAAIGAALGGAIWAAIVHFTGFEVGYVAVGVGALAGFGAVTAAKGQTSRNTGVAAAVCAVLAILGAKYVVVYTVLSQMDLGFDESFSAMQFSDEAVQERLAIEIIDERIDAGKEVSWPAGVDEDEAQWPGEYPKDIVADATSRWNALSVDARAAKREEMQSQVREMVEAFGRLRSPSVQWEMYVSTFDLFDVLWIGLALVTAYRVGAREDA